MNLIIVDSDCQSLFRNEEHVKDLLKDSDALVLFLEINSELAKQQYSLDELVDITKFHRCIFLTELSGGLKEYHKLLVQNNAGIQHWVISILDIAHQNYKEQFFHHIDSMLAETDVLYRVIFDQSVSLQRTCEECRKTIYEKSTCLLVSKDEVLAAKVKELLAMRKPDCDFLLRSELSEEESYDAKVILVLGNTMEDILFAPIKYGLNRIHIWMNLELVGQNKSQIKSRLNDIRKQLTEQGWNFFEDSFNLHCSNLKYEHFCFKWLNQEVSAASFKNDDTFILWDRYGLPLLEQEYTDKTIQDFFDDNCCFAQIIDEI